MVIYRTHAQKVVSRAVFCLGRICNSNCNNNDDEKGKLCREVGIRAHCEGWSHLCAYSSLEYIATLHCLESEDWMKEIVSS